MNKKFNILGLMSGSSLDGLDLAYCQFKMEGDNIISWNLIQAETIPFSEQWKSRLANLPFQSAEIYAKTNIYFSHYLAELVLPFLSKNELVPDFVASHGHTIFHNPDKMFTAQIGDGGALAAKLGLPVVSNFRTTDIALGGEGAPFAPIADHLLYKGYDAYLNLGGIANLTFVKNEQIRAHDVCAANQVLNFLANQIELSYDNRGIIAKSGQFNEALFNSLNKFPYYNKTGAKSLGNEWIRAHILPLFANIDIPIEDALATVCHHIAYQIKQACLRENEATKLKVLASGGGVFNTFLIDLIQQYSPQLEIIIPKNQTIEFKEAILMALMGLLRWNEQVNVLSSTTGSTKDSISGSIYLG